MRHFQTLTAKKEGITVNNLKAYILDFPPIYRADANAIACERQLAEVQYKAASCMSWLDPHNQELYCAARDRLDRVNEIEFAIKDVLAYGN